MTTLVGLHQEGHGTWIGSDLATCFGPLKLGPSRKIIQAHGWALAHSGDSRAYDVALKQANTLLRTTCPLEVAERLRKALIGAGFQFAAESVDGAPMGPISANQGWLLGNGRGLWIIDASFAANEVPSGHIAAEGSSTFFAYGAGLALTSYLDPMPSPELLLGMVIDLANAHLNGTGHGKEIIYLPAKNAVSAKRRVVSHR